jgi:hypothetical protein
MILKTIAILFINHNSPLLSILEALKQLRTRCWAAGRARVGGVSTLVALTGFSPTIIMILRSIANG